MKRLFGSRVFIGALAAALGALLAGGVAWAVTVVPPGSTDRYFACVGPLGRVRQNTIRFRAAPTSCPGPHDVVRSWNAQGPQGIQGPAGSSNTSTLTVAVTAPELGSVTGPGIDCAVGATSDCTEVYPTGTVVQLVASPGSGSFAGWGGACSGTTTCSVTVVGDLNVSAAFGSLTLTKHGTLFTDANANGTVSPGDTLQYTLTIRNTSAVAVPNVGLSDRVGVPAPYVGTDPPRSAALVDGSVTTTAGTITSGNHSGDADVGVTIATIPASGVVTVQYRATAHPMMLDITHGVFIGPAVWNDASLNGGAVKATDPDPPTSGPCNQLASLGVCINADAAA